MRPRQLVLLAAVASLLCPSAALAYGPTEPAVPYVQSLPFLGGGAFTRNIQSPTVQVDPNSATYVSDLVNLVKSQGAFVTDGYQGGDPICVSDSSVPSVPFYGQYPQTSIYPAMLSTTVPVPATCQPDNAKDATMTVYNPATHSLWTTWRTSTPAQNAPGCTALLIWGSPCYGDGRWHYYSGGVARDITKNPGYFDYGSLPGYSNTTWGTSATSTVNAARTVLASEVLNGSIPHAVAVASAASLNCQYYNRWPAQRNDGTNVGAPPTCIPEGTFFRIDPTVNLQALNLPKFTLMVAQAAQRYGLCVCESTQGGPTLQTENTTQYGYNAWTSQYLLFGQTKSSVLRSFPWASLQAVAAPTRYDTGLTQVASTTTATPATTAAAAGQPVSVAVTVTASDGRTVPGAVYVSGSNGTQLQSALLGSATGGGAGTVSVTPPAPGTYTYTISYGGDQTVKPSSASVTVTAS